MTSGGAGVVGLLRRRAAAAVAEARAVPSAVEGVSAAERRAALVSRGFREASPRDLGPRPSPAALLRATDLLWSWVVLPESDTHTAGIVPVPVAGWMRCFVCSTGDPVLRRWSFHRRPGRPTVPFRCDLHAKCSACGAGWWHGIIVTDDRWPMRPLPRHVSLRFALANPHYEPPVWASDRGGHRGP